MNKLICPCCGNSDFELLTSDNNIAHYIVGVDKTTQTIKSKTGILVNLYCCKNCDNIIIKKSDPNI